MPDSPTLVLFNYDWDRVGFARWRAHYPLDSAGFDLFSFPSNLRLAGFDLERFVAGLARRARRRGWRGVTSNHEQFGALAAALLAERMGWPGTPVAAVLACQHKLHARRVLEAVAPEASVPCQPLPARYGEPIPEGLTYPCFAKPVKAAFSVLARTVHKPDRPGFQMAGQLPLRHPAPGRARRRRPGGPLRRRQRTAGLGAHLRNGGRAGCAQACSRLIPGEPE